MFELFGIRIDISQKVNNNLSARDREDDVMKKFLWAAMMVAAVTIPAMAQAKQTSFTAALSGNSVSAHTGSPATATAIIKVDAVAQTVSVQLKVVGISIGGLWDNLVAAPIGPVHLHQYASTDLSDPNASMLAFPLPFGPSYTATADGFSVDTGARPYAEGMATLGSKASFDQFMTAMEGGSIVLNIHTDAFNGGEISGPVVRSQH